jgi:hypothetical protein
MTIHIPQKFSLDMRADSATLTIENTGTKVHIEKAGGHDYSIDHSGAYVATRESDAVDYGYRFESITEAVAYVLNVETDED